MAKHTGLLVTLMFVTVIFVGYCSVYLITAVQPEVQPIQTQHSREDPTVIKFKSLNISRKLHRLLIYNNATTLPNAAQDAAKSVDLATVATQPSLSTELVTSKSTVKAVGEFRLDAEKIRSQGHVFIYSNFEEQTNGARNLWQLEIWAKLMNMKVAEPFAVDSNFGVRGVTTTFSQVLRFSDYYDIDDWNHQVTKLGGNPLIKWEEFLSTAPRNAILFYTIMRSGPEGPQSPLVSYGRDDVRKYNPGKYEQITNDDMAWLNKNFNIIKVVNYIRGKVRQPITLETFNSYIFGKLNPSEVTLVIVNWFGTERVKFRPSKSAFNAAANVQFSFPHESKSMTLVISPSKRVLKAYKSYVSDYIGDRKYLGITFRTHNVLHYAPGVNFVQKSKYLLECSKNLSHLLDRIRNKWELFLAYDMGTYGSIGFYDSSTDKTLIPLRDQIMSDIFNGSLLAEQREQRLLRVADGITDRGFIAIVEKTIATHADCIVLLGPITSFVRSSASTYISLHDAKRCMLSMCAEDYYDQTGNKVSSDDAQKFLKNLGA